MARETDPELAERLAERLRSRIAERRFRYGDQEVQLTCSVGFASYPLPRNRPGLILDEAVLGLADHALHEAQEQGNAWVGLLTSKTPVADEILANISPEDPQELMEQGLLEVRRSVTDAAA